MHNYIPDMAGYISDLWIQELALLKHRVVDNLSHDSNTRVTRHKLKPISENADKLKLNYEFISSHWTLGNLPHDSNAHVTELKLHSHFPSIPKIQDQEESDDESSNLLHFMTSSVVTSLDSSGKYTQFSLIRNSVSKWALRFLKIFSNLGSKFPNDFLFLREI